MTLGLRAVCVGAYDHLAAAAAAAAADADADAVVVLAAAAANDLVQAKGAADAAADVAPSAETRSSFLSTRRRWPYRAPGQGCSDCDYDAQRTPCP